VLQVTRTASQIDAHVGQRMRRRREALGISQGRLGRHLGLTFSQVQKYEKGTNRIGAGRLYQIASFLGVQPGYFFAGLDEPEEQDTTANDVRRKGEASTLSEAFEAIHEPETRASILALVLSLSADQAARHPRN
jgi:transcriptional regulator with XRE-family HTH domain